MKYTRVSILTILLLSLFAFRVSAATVFVEASRDQISVGDSVVVSIKISADGQVINTIDGSIGLDFVNAKASIKEFSLANSVFGMWPRTPSIDPNGKLINFVGGVPGGMSIENAIVFKFILSAEKEGTMTIRPKNVLVFLNDNKGTKTDTKIKDLTIKINPKKDPNSINDWQNTIQHDKTAPEKFIIVLGQDKNIYDGKVFAYFSAVDNQSGIDHYDVIEDGNKAVRSGSVYVPVDGSNKLRLKVIAYDKAGNFAVSYYPESSRPIAWGWVLAIIAVGFFVSKLLRSKNNNVQI